jgi:hypothetical protein
MAYFVIPAKAGIQVISEKPETLGGHRSLSRTRYGVGRDPWFDRPFDRLTVLSEVEGESRKMTNCDTVSQGGGG